MKNKKSFLIAIGVLCFPIAIFFILNTGKPKYETLPIYGNRIPPDGISILDTIYVDTVPDFSVNDQTGNTITKNDLKGCIYIANFFFTSCKGACPIVNHEDSLIYQKITSKISVNKKYAQVKFMSFSVDPENDSVPALSVYAKRFGADPNIWHFCTASRNEIIKINRGFLLPLESERSVGDQITHSQKFVLVDKQNRIRGDYDGLDPKETDRLYDEIKVLLTEYDN